ncbi:MAG: hypothetical protein LBT52_06560 [Clostridiales Family XIII bacterium]|jgi:3-hydroxybutyryl-CoA dehydrogenase|nr:hypothetical protein [Clostridiales Family XIII bacterium]
MEKTPQTITIIGCGTQGSMLAFRSAAYGRTVSIYDPSAEAMQRAQVKIDGWFASYVEAGKLSQSEMEQARASVSAHTDLRGALLNADLIIENVPEILSLKQDVWREIDALAPEKALLTTNSSSLKASDIGRDIGRKDRTFNLNFMTPTTDDLVEVMWNDATSEQTKAAALAFLKAQRNVPIITKREIKGFSLNRMWRAMKKECLKLWADDYISPNDFDRAFVLEWGTEYGPFALMDKVGLDIVKQIELTYYAESGDPSDLPPAALDEYIEKGWLGEKTGRGFYTYPDPAYSQPGWLRGEDTP